GRHHSGRGAPVWGNRLSRRTRGCNLMSSRRHRPGWSLGALALAASFAIGGCGPSGGLPVGGEPTTQASAPASSASDSTCPTTQPAALAAGQTKTITITTPKGTIMIKIDGGLAPIATG